MLQHHSLWVGQIPHGCHCLNYTYINQYLLYYQWIESVINSGSQPKVQRLTTLDIYVNIIMWEGNVNIFRWRQIASEIIFHIFIIFYQILIRNVCRSMFWKLLFTHLTSKQNINRGNGGLRTGKFITVFSHTMSTSIWLFRILNPYHHQ